MRTLITSIRNNVLQTQGHCLMATVTHMAHALIMKMQSGFTLLESLVVLAILAMLASVAMPVIHYRSDARDMAAESKALMMNLRWARSMAVATGTVVTLCPVNALGQCTGLDQPSNRWFALSETSLGTTIIRRFTVRDSVIIRGPAAREGIKYQLDGFSPGSTATLRLCDGDQRWRRSIVINNVGRPRLDVRSGTEPCGT